MSKEEHSIENCFMAVHDNLQFLPDKFCYWKKEDVNGDKVCKKLRSDYRPMFYFINDPELKNNLAELRMCFDYHRSIYEFLKPGLTFGWHHKLVLCQLVGGIYEGVFLDFLKHKAKMEKKNILIKEIAIDKLNNNKIGLGYLIDIFDKADFFGSKKEKWKTYLSDIKYLRNTIHPKSLNNINVSYTKNRVIKSPIDKLIKNLDNFIVFIKTRY